jgi:hypothetical protein
MYDGTITGGLQCGYKWAGNLEIRSGQSLPNVNAQKILNLCEPGGN